MLGRPHEIAGVVVTGEQRGRSSASPPPTSSTTAAPPYRRTGCTREAVLDGVRHPAAISVGTNRPSTEQNARWRRIC